MKNAHRNRLGWVVVLLLLGGCMAEKQEDSAAHRPPDAIDPADSEGEGRQHVEPAEVEPETFGEPAPPVADSVPPATPDVSPLEVPALLSPDAVDRQPVRLRTFNPVRDIEPSRMPQLQPHEMEAEPEVFHEPLSPTLPLTIDAEAIPRIAWAPDSSSGPALAPGLSPSVPSIPAPDAILFHQPESSAPPSDVPPTPEAATADPPEFPLDDSQEATSPVSEPVVDPVSAEGGESAAEDRYTVVRVFYGTDRNALTVPLVEGGQVFAWGIITVGAAVVAVLLGMAALRFRAHPVLRWGAVTAGVVAVLLGGLMLLANREGRVRVSAASEGEPGAIAGMAYGNDRGTVQYGICEVSIPKSHKVGRLEAPSVFRLDFYETPERHVVLTGVEPLESEMFFESLQARVAQSDSRSAFVFVHGFNVTFEDAARRTAQIAYDLKFDGAPILFSWPSQGGLFKYTIDETNVMWTVPHLRKFLTEVAERTDARRIHLVAHSMGNRALTAALRDLSFLPEEKRPRFNEVVLTAPDIDAEVFRKDIAPYIVQTAERVTLYASSNDTALAYSKTVHGYPRAGDSGRELLVLPSMETVDVSEVDTSLLGHNYYGNNETVLADLVEVLHKSLPAQQRRWLRSERLGALEYWVFQR